MTDVLEMPPFQELYKKFIYKVVISSKSKRYVQGTDGRS
jgi:hypothetical protein